MFDKNSHELSVFYGRVLPEPGAPAGYAALWARYGLKVPLPPRLAAVGQKHRRSETRDWLILTPRHRPEDSLAGHLGFALKWEGVDLGVMRQLFRVIAPGEITEIVKAKPTGAYTRRIWFLYEWLTGTQLDIEQPTDVKSVPVVDPKLHYVAERGRSSPRHRVTNNLPGDASFCPLVRRTPELDAFLAKQLDERAQRVIGRTHRDVITRAAAFLLLQDSKASFNIEGQQPTRDRAKRWAQAIAQAGSTPVSVQELERLQKVVIGDDRFVKLGLRTEGSFVGDHDRDTYGPLPEHIGARPEDLRSLVEGMSVYAERAVAVGVDPVVVAAAVAFGFVYVHPFEDGNGRAHRWLIHHVLAEAEYNPRNVVFPISAAILRHLDEYRQVLESYSKPLLPYIEWRPTEKQNVEVLNDTGDYYRYFDATAHAEFLYRCVEETVEMDLPEEVKYLESYDRFVIGVHDVVDMPAQTVDLLHRFLRQNAGRLSSRARSVEFAQLSDTEVERYERLYRQCFTDEES
ncbi:MAG: Fic family protein [Gemmatimonadota bacterium]